MVASQLLTSDLSNPAAAITLRGFLDAGNPSEGLKGWVVDISDPQRNLLVELCADAAVLATAKVDQNRSDIELPGTTWCRVGFHFPTHKIQTLLASCELPSDARLWVKVAGTSFALRSQRPVSPLAEFIAAVEKQGGDGSSDCTPDSEQTQAGSFVGMADPDLSVPVVARNLPSALYALAAQAAGLLRLPLTPGSRKVAGHIECLSWEQEGLVWVFGWMKRRLPLHAPVVVADGGKYPSALVVATHERADLPKDACGIVGLLKTDWRPGHRGSNPLLFLGPAAEACLPLLEKPTLFTARECAERIEALKPELGGPFAKPLLRMFGETTNWSPDNARITGTGVRASADTVLILPGFGCLVEGWALSPLHSIEGFMLRVGKSVLMSEPRSIGSKPRSDLLSFAPDARRMAETGGFVAAFQGRMDEQDRGDAVLKVVCEGGLSTNHPVDAGAIKVLGASADFEQILQHFPAARTEAFFPELARCISEEVRRISSRTVSFETRTADNVLVVAVPDDGSDTALLFSDLSSAAQRRGRLPPVVVVARAGQHRSSVLSLFSDMRLNAAGASSLFFVPNPAYAVYALDEVLGRVGAARFAFVGPGVFPTEEGWDALLDHLEGQGKELMFLAAERSTNEAAPADSGPRAECFAWHRDALSAWLARTPVFLSGSSGRSLALPTEATTASPGALARRGRRPTPSIFATWVNEVLTERSAEAAHA